MLEAILFAGALSTTELPTYYFIGCEEKCASVDFLNMKTIERKNDIVRVWWTIVFTGEANNKVRYARRLLEFNCQTKQVAALQATVLSPEGAPLETKGYLELPSRRYVEPETTMEHSMNVVCDKKPATFPDEYSSFSSLDAIAAFADFAREQALKNE